ncbi:MAG TPA: GNAT family N-acetyltransferase [Gaiellaceae bacterium]|nr:GNAT family N-acetyltransferase [Gaiellaceae bacterium]
MRLEPASSFDAAFLADLFTRGYEGYYVPIHMDAATQQAVVDRWDIDLARSRVAFEGDDPVGLANLAVRGDHGWIGGIGVVPAARRRGVGRALMEAVLAEAPPHVTLEVLEQNEPARALYEQLGFVTRRMLEVWSLTAELEAGAVHEVEGRPLGQDDLPWQRADASLPEGCMRIDVDGGAALFRVTDGTVGIAQLAAAGEDVARELLCTLRARGDRVSYVNVPEDDPASAALRVLGGTLDLRQHEMEWFATPPRSSAPTG